VTWIARRCWFFRLPRVRWQYEQFCQWQGEWWRVRK